MSLGPFAETLMKIWLVDWSESCKRSSQFSQMKVTRFGKVALLLFYLAEQVELILERSIALGVSMLAMLESLSS